MQSDEHFLRVCRYVEGNPLRARLVKRAEQWRWSSLHARVHRSELVTVREWPVNRPRNWTSIVNELLPRDELTDLRESVNRGKPFGSESWVQKTAKQLGLQSTLRPRGRPRKQKKERKE